MYIYLYIYIVEHVNIEEIFVRAFITAQLNLNHGIPWLGLFNHGIVT